MVASLVVVSQPAGEKQVRLDMVVLNVVVSRKGVG
jgi:hypothetical protein